MSTPTQLTNAVGWLIYRINFIQTMRTYALDPNTSPQQATQANQKALQALDDLQILLNTIYTKLARTQPTSTFTDQQLSNMGIV